MTPAGRQAWLEPLAEKVAAEILAPIISTFREERREANVERGAKIILSTFAQPFSDLLAATEAAALREAVSIAQAHKDIYLDNNGRSMYTNSEVAHQATTVEIRNQIQELITPSRQSALDRQLAEAYASGIAQGMATQAEVSAMTAKNMLAEREAKAERLKGEILSHFIHDVLLLLDYMPAKDELVGQATIHAAIRAIRMRALRDISFAVTAAGIAIKALDSEEEWKQAVRAIEERAVERVTSERDEARRLNEVLIADCDKGSMLLGQRDKRIDTLKGELKNIGRRVLEKAAAAIQERAKYWRTGTGMYDELMLCKQAILALAAKEQPL